MFTPEEKAQQEENSAKLQSVLGPVYAKYDPYLAHLRTLPFSEIIAAAGQVIPDFVYTEFLAAMVRSYPREDGSAHTQEEITNHLLAYLSDWLVDLDCDETGLLQAALANKEEKGSGKGHYILHWTIGESEELETDWYYELQHAIAKTISLATAHTHPEFVLGCMYNHASNGDLTDVFHYDHHFKFSFNHRYITLD